MPAATVTSTLKNTQTSHCIFFMADIAEYGTLKLKDKYFLAAMY